MLGNNILRKEEGNCLSRAVWNGIVQEKVGKENQNFRSNMVEKTK